MKDQVDRLLEEINSFTAETTEQVESFRLKFLSKKGLVPAMFAEMRNVPVNEKKKPDNC